MIVFGGTSTNTDFEDTWAYDPAANLWTEMKPEGSRPAGRIFHAMAYDSSSGRVVLFGGTTGDRASERDVEAAPSDGGAELLAYDLTPRLLADDNDTVTNFGDTWTYDPATNEWTEITLAGAQPQARNSPALRFQPRTVRARQHGGGLRS